MAKVSSLATRVLRCPASVSLVEKVPATSAQVIRLCRSRHGAPCRYGPSHRERMFPCGDRRQEDRQLRHHARRCRERPAAGSRLCRSAPRPRPAPSISSNAASSFPTIPGAFGTRDLIVRIGSTVHIIDFKFGTGVRVLALYADGAEDVVNAQLMFYGAAARHSLPEFFAGVDNIVLTILQPHVDRARRRDGVVGRVSPLSLMSLSRSTAPPVRKHFHLRRAWSGGRIAAFAQPGRSARRTPVRCSIWRNSQRRRLPRCPRNRPTCKCWRTA